MAVFTTLCLSVFQKKVGIEHIKRLYKDKQLMIFDSSIVVELEADKGYGETKLTFNSFDNRDEVLESITSIWMASSPHA